MDEFDDLENNVARAIEVIHSLFQKNEELKKENGSLVRKISEYEQAIQQVRDESKTVKNNPDNLQFDTEKENKIRIIIQHIIDKLESFEKLSNNH